MRGSFGALVAVLVVPAGIVILGLPGHAEFAGEGLEGAALADDTLAQGKFLGAARRESAGLVKTALTVLENGAPGEAGLDDAGLHHVEGGFGCEGREENDVGAVDQIIALVLGEIAESLVRVVDVVEEVNPVFGRFVDEVHELVGDDGYGGDFARVAAGCQGVESADVRFGRILVRAARQAAQEALGGFDRVGDRNAFDVGEELTNFVQGHRLSVARIADQDSVEVGVDRVTAVHEPDTAADRAGNQDVAAPNIEQLGDFGACSELNVIVEQAHCFSLASRKK